MLLNDKRGKESRAKPVITGLSISSASATTVTVTWTTDIASTSQVFYGVYAFSRNNSSTLDTALVTSHSVTLTLTNNKTYLMQAESRRTEGELALSEVTCFFHNYNAASISGLVYWHDASSGTYLDAALARPATSQNDAVLGWQDLSSNGNALGTGDAGNGVLKLNAQNGLSAVDMATDNNLKTTSPDTVTNPCTIVVALKAGAFLGRANMGVVTEKSGASNTGLLISDTSGLWRISDGTTDITASHSISTNVILMGLFDSASSALYKNNVLANSGTLAAVSFPGISVNRNRFQIASFGYFNGTYYEIAVYNKALSATERDTLYAYLSAKWSI